MHCTTSNTCLATNVTNVTEKRKSYLIFVSGSYEINTEILALYSNNNKMLKIFAAS